MRISRNIRNFGKIMKEINNYKENICKMNALEKIKANESIDDRMWNFHEMTRGQPQYREFEKTMVNYFGISKGEAYAVLKTEEKFRR